MSGGYCNDCRSWPVAWRYCDRCHEQRRAALDAWDRAVNTWRAARAAGDPFADGWNLGKTAAWWRGYSRELMVDVQSPQAVAEGW